MKSIKKHYASVSADLTLRSTDEARDMLRYIIPGKVIIPVQTLNRSFVKTLRCALSCGFSEIELYNVTDDEQKARRLRAQLDELDLNVEFVYDVTAYRNVNEVLIKHVEDEAAQLHENLTVMMGALVVTSPLKKLLHNQTTQRLSKKLERYRNVSVFTVPYII